MDKVYFSRIGDGDEWVKENDSGIFHILLIPKKWWIISHWKLSFDIQNNFKSGFITKSNKTSSTSSQKLDGMFKGE